MSTARPRGGGRGGELVAWTNGQTVGSWTTRGDAHQFQYSPGWLASPHARPLSLSLPFTPGNLPHRGPVVRHFFDNLLPDNTAIRRRLRERFRTEGADAFALLAAIGRDCVGAVQLLPPGEEPAGFDRVDMEPLDEAGVEQALHDATAPGRVLGIERAAQFRISIAGAQEKTALLWHGGRWCVPRGATPTTHIFKLPLGLIGNLQADMRHSVENEWLCGRLLALMGLPVAHSEIARFGATTVLVVERFDRAWQQPAGAAPWIARLPQEDFCQALGVAGEQRYESDGGPGMAAILRRLEASKQPAADRLVFLQAQFLFWLMAATDGHAKNFSLLLERDGFRLAPLYDVLSVWPIVGDGRNQLAWRDARLAMAVRASNAHYHLFQVRARHWEALARQVGGAPAFDALVALALQVPQVLGEMAGLLPDGFPEPVFASIRAGMLAQAERFVGELD